MPEKLKEQFSRQENKEKITEVFNFKQKNGNIISFLSSKDCWHESRKTRNGMPLAEGILCDIILKTPENKILSFKKEFLPDGWCFEIIASPDAHANPKEQTAYLSHPNIEEINNEFYPLMVIHEAKHAWQEEKNQELTDLINYYNEDEVTNNKESALQFLRHFSKIERDAWVETLKEYRRLKQKGINITNADSKEIRKLIDKECLGSRLRVLGKYPRKHTAAAKIIKEYLASSPPQKGEKQERFFLSKDLLQ